jgi:cytochrome P450
VFVREVLRVEDDARRCLGEHLAWAELAAVLPVVLDSGSPRALPGGIEPMVLRGTILVPKRSGLVLRP